jgi:hypothetical protein
VARDACFARSPPRALRRAAKVRGVPTEVIATPRAGQQIAGLDRTHARAFGEFLDDLAARGCQALGYRLSGPAPVDHLCVKHLRDSLRVVVAFEGQRRAWILLVGRHDDQDPILNVYAELYRLLGVEPPDSAGRDKPPCCDQNTDLPPVLGAAVTELVERAAKVRRTRHQAASLPACVAPSSSGTDRELALFAACRRFDLVVKVATPGIRTASWQLPARSAVTRQPSHET